MSRFDIRPLEPSDRNAAEWALMAAFGGVVPAPISVIERHLALGPSTSFVAVRPEDGVIAGVVCAVLYGTPPQLSYIGPMAVEPEFQGQGIGRRLFARLMDTLDAAGCRSAMLDATDAGEPLYRKFGFEDAGLTLDMNRTEPESAAGLAPRTSDLQALAAADRASFGFDRTYVLRRLLDQEHATGFTTGTATTPGHLIAQAKVIGPFAAPDPGTAALLLDQALEAGSKATRILAPAENPHVRQVLEPRGFRAIREVKHMHWGEPCPSMRRHIIYGLASFALG